jgi:ABC-type glucose/galactose transport system permease subunit
MLFIGEVLVESVRIGTQKSICTELQRRYQSIEDLLERFVQIAKNMGFNASDYDSITLHKTSGHKDQLSWRWQQCTELGWFQVPNLTTYPLMSSSITEEFWTQFCKNIFGPETELKINPGTYGQLSLKAENVYLTTQTLDPWQELEIKTVDEES